MKKKEATKKETKGNKKSGRGGARPGAGRKSKFGPVQQTSVDLPEVILEAMSEAGINNKTQYILYLMSKDLANNQTVTAKQRIELQTIADDTEDNYF